MTASHGSRVLAGLVAVVLAGAGLGAQEPPPEVTRAQFDAWMTELSNWGRWGDDDQLGALNLITPAKRVEAARLVRTGQVVSMARPIELQVLDDPDAAGAIAAPAGLSGSGPSAESATVQGRSLPVFEVDPAWPAVPAGMRLGAPSSIAIDAEDNVWVLHRPLTLPAEEDAMAAPPVVVFDAEGNFIRAWGGPGDGYEWPQREHGLHIDHEGFVWLGGNNCPTNGVPRVEPVHDDQLLKFTRDGAFVMQIGRTDGSRGNADMMNVHRPADQQVHPPTNELFVADGYGNRRVAVFDAETGRFKRRWGAFGDTPVDDDQCQVQNPTSFSDPGPSYFNVLHAIRVSNDGLVYAADREHRRVQVFTLGGAFVSQVVTPDAPFARNLALSPDAEQQLLYVGGDDGIVVVDRATLDILGTVRPEGILGAGHHIATDSQGNLYLAATGAGMQKLTFRGMSGAQ